MISATTRFLGLNTELELSDNLGYASNMRNFKVTDEGALKKRPSILTACITPYNISAIWAGQIYNKKIVLIAAGGRLFEHIHGSISQDTTFVGNIGYGKCMIFRFGNEVYIKTESSYQKYNGSRLVAVEGYIPLIALSCNPKTGAGELFEQLNLISNKRRQLFSSDGETTKYKLAEIGIDAVYSVKFLGVEDSTSFTLDSKNGEITFSSPFPKGLNNVEITYSLPESSSDKNRIFKCTRIMFFGGNSDGRAFLWGNADFPNYRFHSELANGVPSVEYFPINSFTIIGKSKINCITQQYDRQLIFTEDEAFYSYCELKDDGLNNIFSSFPVFSLNGSKGCIIETNSCTIDNSPVTVSLDGINVWQSTSIQNEKNASVISKPIDSLIKKILKRGKIELLDLQAFRELFIIHEGIAYIYNYGNNTWYIYDGFIGDCYCAFENAIYFAKGDVLYFFDENYSDVDSNATAIWESVNISKSHSGLFDLNKIEADIYYQAPIKLSFTVIKNDYEKTSSFNLEHSAALTRISLRSALKRVMPFKLKITAEGYGLLSLYSLKTKTREKERSKRFGIL